MMKGYHRDSYELDQRNEDVLARLFEEFVQA